MLRGCRRSLAKRGMIKWRRPDKGAIFPRPPAPPTPRTLLFPRCNESCELVLRQKERERERGRGRRRVPCVPPEGATTPRCLFRSSARARSEERRERELGARAWVFIARRVRAEGGSGTWLSCETMGCFVWDDDDFYFCFFVILFRINGIVNFCS